MAKLTQQSVNGTSFHNVTITTTVNHLTEILGKPDLGDGEKTNYEWNCETEDGKPFTIYDWKEYGRPGVYSRIEFHIGAHDKMQSLNAYYELIKMLTK